MQRRWLIAMTLALALAAQGLSLAYADDAEHQLVDLVNAERARHGLAGLTVSPELSVAAHDYAKEMADGNFFGHRAPDGSTFVQRDLAAGYRGGAYLEENLAAGQGTPQQALAAWLASPTHRSNLLSPRVTEIGIGHVYRGGTEFLNYWVGEFGDHAGTSRTTYRVSSRGGERTPPASPPHTARSQAPAATVEKAPLAAPPASLASQGEFGDLGRPLTGVISDSVAVGEKVQYFQRAVLEWHPENPPASRIEPRLLGDILFPGADPPLRRADAPPGPSDYFPLSPGQTTGLGHFVADYTRDGQPIYFKDYFDKHGGVAAFGYPKEEPRLHDGLWTQRFQAAVFQYHPEYDRDGIIPGTDLPWRYFRVQLRLLGEQYVAREGISLH